MFAYGYYTAMEAVAQGLEQVNGDLSGNHEAFNDALASLVLDAPLGPIKLDENHQAIMDNFLQQIVKDNTGDGVPDVKTIKTIPQVDQTFAGAFSPETPVSRPDPSTVQDGHSSSVDGARWRRLVP